MSASSYTDPSIEARPAFSFVGFWAALANPTTGSSASLEEAESTLQEGEASVGRGIESIARLLANSRMAAERGEAVPWDYLIERLEFYASEAAHDLTQIRKLVDRILALVRYAQPRDKRRARALTRRQEDAVVRFVETLREARWQAMAARAHFDTDSRVGPTFDNAVALRAYLVSR